MMTDKPNPPDAGICKPKFELITGSIEPLHPGSLCPNCGQGIFDYNGLLELECLICGNRNTDSASYI
jgi:hypothetical protein